MAAPSLLLISLMTADNIRAHVMTTTCEGCVKVTWWRSKQGHMEKKQPQGHLAPPRLVVPLTLR